MGRSGADKVLKRMFFGSLLGGILFFILTWAYNYATGFLPEKLNPYVETFPLMRSVCFAWVGSVVGALAGLITSKRED
ncbi:MAG: hypothetical protein D6778_08600 [Nitrospirae bacterium]|nr:MAG: hypothetical protein D6778_08600 [Nitrospirota bacterium]